MGQKGTLHIVRPVSAHAREHYRAAFVKEGREPTIEALQRELMSEQEVLQFLERVLDAELHDVRHYYHQLLAKGRVRIGNVDEDRYYGLNRAA